MSLKGTEQSGSCWQCKANMRRSLILLQGSVDGRFFLAAGGLSVTKSSLALLRVLTKQKWALPGCLAGLPQLHLFTPLQTLSRLNPQIEHGAIQFVPRHRTISTNRRTCRSTSWRRVFRAQSLAAKSCTTCKAPAPLAPPQYRIAALVSFHAL